MSHTLWMIEQVGLMAEQGKIDRWTGWVCAKTHSLGVIDRYDEALGGLRSLCRTDLGDRE